MGLMVWWWMGSGACGNMGAFEFTGRIWVLDGVLYIDVGVGC